MFSCCNDGRKFNTKWQFKSLIESHFKATGVWVELLKVPQTYSVCNLQIGTKSPSFQICNINVYVLYIVCLITTYIYFKEELFSELEIYIKSLGLTSEGTDY